LFRRLAPFMLAAGLAVAPALAVGVTPAPAGATQPASGALPKVTGAIGSAPRISFPNAKPPTKLVVVTLHKGNGPKVAKGDLIITNYVGAVWRGSVFDSSFKRKVPFGTPIGVGQVIPAWDKGLVGQTVGSRVLLVAPPVDAYGSAQSAPPGLSKSDTLVFVVDIIASYGEHPKLPTDVTRVSSGTAGVKVTGAPGKEPTITISKKAPVPSSAKVTVLDAGHGPKITPGLLVFEVLAKAWTGQTLESSWTSSPQAADAGIKANPTLLDPLVGKRLGSRILITSPGNSSSGLPPYAAVVDVFAEYR
jgi:peptidylprolyl isomerase